MLAAVDIETYDPHLKDWGSGAVRKDGHILGVGIYCPVLGIDDYFQWYNPKVKEVLEDKLIDKVFHNGIYDTDWLHNWAGYEINGRIEDTMTRETLLDAYSQSYRLDDCCARRGCEGKNKDDTIDKWWAENGGKGKAVQHLAEIPRSITAKYCRQDCKATYDLYYAQQPLLEAQDLLRANDIEVRLMPMLIQMRGHGIKLDWSKHKELSDFLASEYDRRYKELCDEYGFEINLNSANDLEKIWKIEGLPVEYTATGRPSFTRAALLKGDHEIGKRIQKIKGIDKVLNTFVDGQFVDQSYNGRLWTTIYPAKRDDGGTVTGRMSSQNINLQQVPAREDKYGDKVRSLFIPEDNCFLGAFDFKQVEYKIFTHYAIASKSPGYEFAVKLFEEQPDIDFHDMGQKLLGWEKYGHDGRKLVKQFGFGELYGLGAKTFAAKFGSFILGVHPEADPNNLEPLAKSLMDEYVRKVPFIHGCANYIRKIARQRGYVLTLGGRRQRLHPNPDMQYVMTNYLVQGSAADVLKKSLVDAWEAGCFNELYSHVLVHDEVVFSIPPTKAGYEACIELRECMKHAYELTLPLGVDTEIGEDWGNCTMDNWYEFEKAYKGGVLK